MILLKKAFSPVSRVFSASHLQGQHEKPSGWLGAMVVYIQGTRTRAEQTVACKPCTPRLATTFRRGPCLAKRRKRTAAHRRAWHNS